MLLDMQKLFSHQDAAQSIPFSLDFTQEDIPGCRAVAPCEGSLDIAWEGHGRRLRLKLAGSVRVETECARCLEPLQREIPFTRTVLLSAQDWMESEEDLPLQGNKLDVSELVYTEIVVSVPSTFLCSEDCEGLCPVCGRQCRLGCGCKIKDVTDGGFTLLD